MGARSPILSRAPTVHPRVGGEHRLIGPVATRGVHAAAGSSPRGRGTPPQWTQSARIRRYAGSSPRGRGTPLTARFDSGARWTSVHPRVGGEHLMPDTLVISADPASGGSSPRGRGTPGKLRSRRGRRESRFIPAWAGNTTSIPASLGRRTQYRFIPAWAGNTSPMAPSPALIPRCAGSSPRGRGTRTLARPRSRSSPKSGSSPRGRGTLHHGTAVLPWSTICGSSPRGRGTQGTTGDSAGDI